MCWAGGAFRRVQNRGGVGPDIASFSQTRCDAAVGHHRWNIDLRYPAEMMRSRGDQQRGVGLRHWIEMNPQSDHAGEDLERRSHVQRPMLPRPRSESLGFDPVPNRDDAVLMPSQRPVGSRRLVKEDRPDRPRAAVHGSRCNRADRAVWLQVGAQSFHLEEPHARNIPRLIGEHACERRKRVLTERLRIQLSTVSAKFKVRVGQLHVRCLPRGSSTLNERPVSGQIPRSPPGAQPPCPGSQAHAWSGWSLLRMFHADSIVAA